jgi:hypothetical protein
MNGMKNYLVKHGEKDFGVEVDKARASLKFDEFLNLDQILEGVMHQLIVLPLKEYLYELFVDYYGSRGEISLIIDNMKFAENKDPEAFGVKVSCAVAKRFKASKGMTHNRQTTNQAHGIDSQFVNLSLAWPDFSFQCVCCARLYTLG